MEYTDVFAALSFVVSASTYFFYVRAILESSARPTLSVWIGWLIPDATILAGMLAQKKIAWQLVAYTAGCTIVILVCLWKGAAVGWKWLDTTCVGIIILATVLWAISGDPNIAITLSLIATTIGCIPMVPNVWKDPRREPLLPWCLVTTGGIFGVAAIPAMTIGDALAPV